MLSSRGEIRVLGFIIFGLLLGMPPVSARGEEIVPSTLPERSLEIVKKFALLDFEGYRLGSEGHQAIWNLTIEDGEPDDSPMYLVKAYQVLSPQKTADGSFQVSVNYDVIGLVDEDRNGLYFKNETFVDKEGFPVKCVDKLCKIDLNRNIFHIPPHVSKEAILAWLKGLEGIRKTSEEKQAGRQTDASMSK